MDINCKLVENNYLYPHSTFRYKKSYWKPHPIESRPLNDRMDVYVCMYVYADRCTSECVNLFKKSNPAAISCANEPTKRRIVSGRKIQIFLVVGKKSILKITQCVKQFHPSLLLLHLLRQHFSAKLSIKFSNHQKIFGRIFYDTLEKWTILYICTYICVYWGCF